MERSLNPNRHLKEQFVSNLSGSSMAEIAALSFIFPALIVLRQWTGFFPMDDIGAKKTVCAGSQHKNWKAYMSCLMVDFLFIVLPILASFTVLAERVYTFATLLAFLLLLTSLTKRFSLLNSDRGISRPSSLRNDILSYRVAMVIVTCLCILAVDFKIFPRRYAKTETYGISLMDLGVGSFIVANALVSRQARNVKSIKWKSVLQSTTPLVLLGILRLVSTTGVDYQVHVGEYGVHWNFFFTLAAVSLLTSLINMHPQYCGMFALLVLTVYQICLSCGLNEYLLSDNRSFSIISQNKEGLFSIFGYWGMYLVGVYFGYEIFFGSKSTSCDRARITVWMLSLFLWLLTIILDKHVERVSRRMCNLAYVALVFAQNFQVLAVLMLSDLIPSHRPLLLEEAFNQNLLGAFLIANVFTGIVNFSVDTLSSSSFPAFCILLGYSIILSASVGLAGFRGIRIKFW